MSVSRRDFLKGAAIAGAGLAASGLPGGASAAKVNEPGEGPRYGMVINLNKCFGCHACSVSCKAEQDVPLGSFKNGVIVSEKGRYPNVSRSFVPILCNHCNKPPCVEVCPVDATQKRSDGIVNQKNNCIRCGACVEACPYKMKYLDTRPDKRARKCDFCMHRLAQGMLPACINTCNARARIFGDLNDPKSEISKLIAANPVKTLQPEQGTEPSVFYIGLEDGAYQVLESNREMTPAYQEG